MTLGNYGPVVIRFENKDVEEDGTLFTLAQCLLRLYNGNNSFLNSMKTQLALKHTLTDAQTRGVLNTFVSDERLTLPLMMRLNDDNEEVDFNTLKSAAIKRAKTRERITEITHDFTNVEVIWEDKLDALILKGNVANSAGQRISPSNWKVGIRRVNPARGFSVVHFIHPEQSFIQDNIAYVVSFCGKAITSIPDVFERWELVKLLKEENSMCRNCWHSVDGYPEA